VLPEQRFRAVVGYDGTDFLGFQIQAQGRTVQGEIEKALENVTQSSVRIDAAGRTDAGVHATGQVIAFLTSWRHPIADLHRALNATLPADVVISNLTTTDRGFHPRFEAISRTYQYCVVNQNWPDVLRRRYAYHISQPIDWELMNEAAQYLIGHHDFASFGKPPQGNKTVRHVMEAAWAQNSQYWLTFTITANAFLYRMVRNIVGTLLQVGTGIMGVDLVPDIMAARDLSYSSPPAPAHGLCLIKVTYPDSLQ
jgi:tRNA pseudouridine38-40 synthase